MEIFKNHTKKLCSFYVSDWHLVTMLLPYINKNINEKANIITFLENNIEENIKTLLSRTNLNNKKEILKINWNSSKIIKYSNLNQKLTNYFNSNNRLNIILINGSLKYIDHVNTSIDKFINKNFNKFNDKKIKIVNCYEVSEFNTNIDEILNTHDKILNTSGEKEIEEVFAGHFDTQKMC